MEPRRNGEYCDFIARERTAERRQARQSLVISIASTIGIVIALVYLFTH